MGSVRMVLILLICHVAALNTEVEAARYYNISREEDMELEKQLKLVNKPSVKSIKSDYGDIYDCVDFYEQPGFDHPLLKERKFDYKMEMKPTFSSKSENDQVFNGKGIQKNFGFKDGGCPAGTVPIRRITKEDLIRERRISKIRPMVGDDLTGAHYAVIRTNPSEMKYNGAGGHITVHRPDCSDPQYSAARVKVSNSADSIEVGWRVDPGLYGDKETRMFIRLDAGAAHCFNTRCPGFILVRSDVALDMVLIDESVPGGWYKYIRTFLNRDLINGSWWVQLGTDLIDVGFWPRHIFSGLSDWATDAEWGGEVYSPPGTIKPPMGLSEPIKEDTAVDAYIFQCRLLDGKNTIAADDVETFADSENYRVKDMGRQGDDGKVVIYGGPSGY